MKIWAKVENWFPQVMNNWPAVNCLSLDCCWKEEAAANQGQKMTKQQDMTPATAQENNIPVLHSTHVDNLEEGEKDNTCISFLFLHWRAFEPHHLSPWEPRPWSTVLTAGYVYSQLIRDIIVNNCSHHAVILTYNN